MLTLLDEFVSLNEEKSVSKTFEELIAFTAHASESAASCTMDIDSKMYRCKCNQCKYKAKHQKYLKQHIQSKHMGIRHYCNKCEHQFIEKTRKFYT